MNPKDNVQENSNHFATSSKSVLSTSESCLTMTSVEDETIEKKKRRSFFIAASIINIQNLICKIKTFARPFMFCVSGNVFFFYLLHKPQSDLKIFFYSILFYTKTRL